MDVLFVFFSGGKDISDYSRIAPPNSFIHVRNFTSPELLAEHLNHIASNDDAFNYYHQWKNEYTMDQVIEKDKIGRCTKSVMLVS